MRQSERLSAIQEAAGGKYVSALEWFFLLL
jgi:hypothetical protein